MSANKICQLAEQKIKMQIKWGKWGKWGKQENVANRKSGYSIDKRIIYFLLFGSATKQTPVKP